MAPWILRVALAMIIACYATAQPEVPGTVSPAAPEPEATQASTAVALTPTPRAAVNASASATAADVSEDMRSILKKVGSIPCSAEVRSRMYALLYENNRGLHDRCYTDCGYQFFPLSKDRATTTQIVAAANSHACVTLFSGVILANFPECDVDMVSTRSCAEILMRIKKDIDEKRTPPTEKQFFELYNLNRVVNLLNENASLIEDAFRTSSTRISPWEMTKMMNRIYISPDVRLDDDMTILVREAGKETTKPTMAGTATPKPASGGWKQANVAFSDREGSTAGSSDAKVASSDSSSTSEGSESPSSASSDKEESTPMPLATTKLPSSAVNETKKASGASHLVGGAVSMAVAVAASSFTFMHL